MWLWAMFTMSTPRAARSLPMAMGVLNWGYPSILVPGPPERVSWLIKQMSAFFMVSATYS